jgi:hypothetical protein
LRLEGFEPKDSKNRTKESKECETDRFKLSASRGELARDIRSGGSSGKAKKAACKDWLPNFRYKVSDFVTEKFGARKSEVTCRLCRSRYVLVEACECLHRTPTGPEKISQVSVGPKDSESALSMVVRRRLTPCKIRTLNFREKGGTAMSLRFCSHLAPKKVAFFLGLLTTAISLCDLAVAQAPATAGNAHRVPPAAVYPAGVDYRCIGAGSGQLFPGTPTITATWLDRGFLTRAFGLSPAMPPRTVYQPFVAGPPVGTVVYPYYTVRGPRDFLAKDPPSIGP